MTGLTKIEKPFGLLDKETQEALQAWPQGIQWYTQQGWEGETVAYWSGEERCYLFGIRFTNDTHRVTLRFTGESPPVGEYTGPDGASFTVEELS